MMPITLRHDAAASIAVPHAVRSPEERIVWSRATAETFSAEAGLDAQATGRIAAALDDLADATGDDHRTLLLVAADGRVLAPFTVFLSDEPLTSQVQASFLWSPSGILPATTEVVESDHLGAGFSATQLERHGDHDYGFRRWLFAGENGAVGAVLGPVAPYGLAFVEEVASAILRESSVEGFEPSSDRARLEELDAAVTRAGEEWPL